MMAKRVSTNKKINLYFGFRVYSDSTLKLQYIISFLYLKHYFHSDQSDIAIHRHLRPPILPMSETYSVNFTDVGSFIGQSQLSRSILFIENYKASDYANQTYFCGIFLESNEIICPYLFLSYIVSY